MNLSTKHDIAGDGRQRGSAASSRRTSSCRSVQSARSCQSSRTKMSKIEGDEEKENMEMDKSMSVEWSDSHTSCRGRGITDEKRISRRKKVRQVGVGRTNHRSSDRNSDRSSDRSARITRRSTEDRTKNASMGVVDVIELLARRGADLEAVDVNGKTALHFAAKKGDPRIVYSLFLALRLEHPHP